MQVHLSRSLQANHPDFPVVDDALMHSDFAIIVRDDLTATIKARYKVLRAFIVNDVSAGEKVLQTLRDTVQ